MTNTTDEYLSVDGVSLQTYAYNLSTRGEREGSPPVRGTDILIPSRPGRRYVPKEVDSRILPLSGWVIGADPDGTVRDAAKLRSNWRMLRRLLYGNARSERVLTKRWREAGAMVTAEGRGQMLDELLPSHTGPQRATFKAELYMADPFFYGPEVTVTLARNVPQTIVVAGDERTSAIKVRFQNALTAARVTVGQQWVGYSALAAAANALVDVSELTSLETVGSVVTPTLGKVSHGPGAPWLHLYPGSNTLTLTSTAGTGNAVLTYRPVWF